MLHKMRVEDYEVSVHLGCSAEEQKYLQPVRFQVELTYQNAVLGCRTDQLNDATDYVELADAIKSAATQKNYHLIEHLNEVVLQSLKACLAKQGFKGVLKLTVHKVRVPVENLRGGVFFTCELEI